MAGGALRMAVYRALPRPLQRLAVRLATPSYTVGAVGLVTDGTRLLLVEARYREGWRPPGGFLSRNERPVEALTRELREELGVEARVAEPHRAYLNAKRRWITFLSVATIDPSAPLAIDEVELKAAEWFPLDALPPLAEDYDEQLTAEDLAAIRSGELLDPR